MRTKPSLSLIVLAFIAAFLMAGCGGSATAELAEESAEDSHSHQEDADHDHHEHEEHGGMDHIHVDPPAEFAQLANPVAGDADAIAMGETLFQTNCVACHGAEGKGDGEAAAGLDPAPANLADAEMMEMMNDGYLFWRITKGGTMEPFNSAMPSWEPVLTEAERWQVVSYVRSLSHD